MPTLQIFLPDGSQTSYELSEEKTTVGRADGNMLRIEDPSVSSHHAEIVLSGDQLHVRDLGSTNGTFLNGERIPEGVVNAGDELRFGAVVCMLGGADAGSGTAAQPLPETFVPATAAGSDSSRPSDFVCTSPIPRDSAQKDPAAIAAWVLGGLALAAAAAAAIMGLALSA